MHKDKQWYLAWQPGAHGYGHDETIVAAGLRCGVSAVSLHDVISWLGVPVKVCGNAKAGHLVYFFDSQDGTAGQFTVEEGRVTGFGTITRKSANTVITDKATGQETPINILDTMVDYAGSEFEQDGGCL
jgi:hypothetical protein